MAGFNRKVLTVANLIISLSILSECLNIKVHKDKELFEISPHLYGFTFEEANGSGDGGILSQRLRNNGLQGDEPSLVAYEPAGDVELSVDSENPLSDAIPHSLAVTVLSDSEDLGFSNLGYYGISPDDGKYTTGFYMKGDYRGSISVKLRGDGEDNEDYVHGSASLDVNSTASEFRYFEAPLPATRSESPARWELKFDESLVAGETFYFDLIQLWGPYVKNLPRDQDQWMAWMFKDTKPSFLHFPGGNDLLGNTTDSRWKWNETIGALKDRPGRENVWGYPTTDALGLVEYFNWCEDLKIAPVLAVYAGLSLEEDVITGTDLKPYIDDVMDELEYILGSTSTSFGALRKSHGYPDPFPLEYVEIGYEDNLSNGGPSYPERFSAFYDAIHKAYPNLTIIASNMEYLPDSLPENTWVDFHIHSAPDELVDHFDKWDSQDRNVPVVVGEYACTTRNDGTPLEYPESQGTVAEAVFMIGLERNSDVVKMASYGFTLQNLANTQTGPSLFATTNREKLTIQSTSYFVQELFSSKRGKFNLKTSSDGDFGPVYWVASHTGTQYIVKMANYSPDPQTISVEIEYSREGKLHILSGLNATSHNSPIYEEDANIFPDNKHLETNEEYRFNITLTPWSVAVLETYAPSLAEAEFVE